MTTWTSERIAHDGPGLDDERVVVVKLADEDSYTHTYDTIRVRWPRSQPIPAGSRYMKWVIVEAWRHGWVELLTLPRVETVQPDDLLDRAIALTKDILS